MSDGWDDSSAYGHVHRLALPADAANAASTGGGGPDGRLSSLRLVARNSGLFYLAATRQCNALSHAPSNALCDAPCIALSNSGLFYRHQAVPSTD